jgi:hypothetical protein
MAKILKSNGVFVCRSTLRHLTDEELDSSVHKDMRCKFDESIEHHLGPAALPQDFPAEDLTPDLTYYDDTNALDPEYGGAKVMSKIGDNYLSAELMLPKGSVMVKGHETACKHDRDVNPVRHANDNPILAPVGGPAQDLPKFQIPCMIPKSVQTCSIYSPDGDSKVSLKKNDPFMTNGCRIVAPAEVTSD